jgi:hypothetical protein
MYGVPSQTKIFFLVLGVLELKTRIFVYQKLAKKNREKLNNGFIGKFRRSQWTKLTNNETRKFAFAEMKRKQLFSFFAVVAPNKRISSLADKFADRPGRVARFFLVQNTKTGKNIPNDH